MACEAPPGECLHFHIRPKITGAGPIRQDGETKRYYFTGPCPAHDDRKPSLKISVGSQRRIVWFCHAGCSERKIRHALIDGGIHSGCLPRSAAELRDLEEELRAILTSDLSHADARLHALALIDSPGGKLPAGNALVSLAAAVRVSRSGAFGARDRQASRTTK